jgi:nitroreductase
VEIFDAIAGRKSIRRFTNEAVPPEDIAKIIRAAGLAPSGGNQQMWHFLVVKNRDTIARMKQAVLEAAETMLQWPEATPYSGAIEGLKTYGTFFADAPVVIAALTKAYRTSLDSELLPKHGLSFEEIYTLRGCPARQSLGAAIQNMLLTAHSMSYGACWMTAPLYANPALRGILNVKPEWELAAVIPLGRPAERPNATPRRSVEEIFTVIE